MRYVLILLWMLIASVTSAMAQVSVGIGLPGVSIGINVPVYPELVPVPGYPVYYAPGMNSNYFFYDGMYWVYRGDNWYASSWYNGPWGLVGPEVVPLFVLRVPVSYYREPPLYFRGWRSDAPPRWGEHWGNQWEQRRSGWDNWNRGSAPRPAPLPVYQRQYSGDRYPQAAQQQALRTQNYRYQPRETVVRQQLQAQAVQKAPAASQRGQQNVPTAPGAQAQTPQKGGENVQRAAPTPASPPKGGQSVQRPAPTQASPQKGGETMQRAAPAQAAPQRGGENMQRPAPAQAAPQRGGENMQRAAPAQAAPQRGGENMQRAAPAQAPPQRGGENMQRAAPTQAPAQQRAPAVQSQRPQPQQAPAVQSLRPQPQQGAAQHAPQEPGRGQGQGQAKEREKGQ